MQLGQLFNTLSYGVLSNLAIGSEGLGNIPEMQRPKVVHHINMALIELYGLFNLIERELMVNVVEGIYLYQLLKVHAESDVTPGYTKYLDDVNRPEDGTFTEDVIKILAVYTVEWEEVTLNDPGDPTSLFTPTPTSLQIPEIIQDDCYHILYQASHPVLDATSPVALDQPILLPTILRPALEAHVAYQVYSAMTSPEATQKAVELLGRFEALCSMVEAKDLVTTSLIQTTTKLQERGFV
jgi:hypothetical protein